MRLDLGIATCVLAVVLLPLEAGAYPYLQHSSGTVECGTCHQSPSGGGLLTDYGRTESGDTVSLGGDGRFLHGLVTMPSWLSIGGTLRLAALANDTGATEGAEFAAFPMQADLTVRVGEESLAAVVTVGARGRTRVDTTRPESEFAQAPTASAVMSREHYVMWAPVSSPFYVRTGRCYPAYGLRLADHTAYVRRFLGTNLLEESYGVGGGFVEDSWELHLTGFVADPWQPAFLPERGGAATAEVHFERLTLGASARAGFGPGRMRSMAGLFGRWWWPETKLAWMAELDGVLQDLQSSVLRRYQLAAYVGPVWMPTRGVYGGLAYELFDEDLAFRGTERHGLGAWVSFFPWAHLELMLSSRAQLLGSERSFVTMLQLHYYL